MAPQLNKAAYAAIVGVISSEAASAVSNISTSFSNTTINIQDDSDSRRCRNVIRLDSSDSYTVSSTIFSDQVVYQQVVLNIVDKITSDQSDNNAGKFFTPEQKNEAYAMILNIISTKLDSNTMVTIGQNTSSVTVNAQYCSNSVGGVNYITGNSDQLMTYYNELYSRNAIVQAVAADISNYIDGTQSNKATGILTTLVRMIAIVIIGVVILAIVIVGAYLITLKGG